MLRGIYSAASNMVRAQRRQDRLSHDITNLGTHGYRGERAKPVGFNSVLQGAAQGGLESFLNGGSSLSVGSGVMLDDYRVDLSQGAMRQTDNNLDFAIAGDGLFSVRGTDGNTYYTRDGSFTRNLGGQLTTTDGLAVLGENGPITLGPGPVKLRPTGEILQGERVVGRLRIVAFADVDQVQKHTGNLLKGKDGAEPVAVAGPKIEQGVLEGSNVDLSRTMTEMLAILRSYEASQRALKMSDEAGQRAATEIGRA